MFGPLYAIIATVLGNRRGGYNENNEQNHRHDERNRDDADDNTSWDTNAYYGTRREVAQDVQSGPAPGDKTTEDGIRHQLSFCMHNTEATLAVAIEHGELLPIVSSTASLAEYSITHYI